MSGFKRKLRFVPSLLTCSSAFCGMLSTFLALEGEKSLVWAAYLILLAAVFDFSDGFAARLLDACSDLGKQLDSLADAISFGVAPSAILFQFLKQSMRLRGGIFTFEPWEIAVLLCSILIAVFAILRLAKFNIDPEQAHSFKGLASPACAMFMASIPLIDATVPEDLLITSIFDAMGSDIEFKWEMILIGLEVKVIGKWFILLPMAMFVAVMMVTNLPMFSLKLKSLKYKEHTLVFNFLIFAVMMLVLFKWLAVPILIFAYIGVSFFKWLRNRKKEEKL